MTGFDDGDEIIDLSLTLSESLPGTWPGHMPLAHHNWSWFAEDPAPKGPMRSLGPYQTNFLVVDEHCGTHFDAPAHFVAPEDSQAECRGLRGLETGERVPLGELMGSAAVVDVRELANAGAPAVSPLILPAHIHAWEAQHGPLEAGEVVLLRTGWDAHYVEGAPGDAYLEAPVRTGSGNGWPAPAPETLLDLHGRGIRTIGIDAPSVGPVHAPIETHRAGLTVGMRFVEGLANLGLLPPRGAFFIFLPLKVARSSGAPGRAVAIVRR
ncbi:MAG: cyclase family protein [Conexibacter sp.]